MQPFGSRVSTVKLNAPEPDPTPHCISPHSSKMTLQLFVEVNSQVTLLGRLPGSTKHPPQLGLNCRFIAAVSTGSMYSAQLSPWTGRSCKWRKRFAVGKHRTGCVAAWVAHPARSPLLRPTRRRRGFGLFSSDVHRVFKAKLRAANCNELQLAPLRPAWLAASAASGCKKHELWCRATFETKEVRCDET